MPATTAEIIAFAAPTTRPVHEMTAEDLADDCFGEGLHDLQDAFDALALIKATYQDAEWNNLWDYDPRLLDVLVPLIDAAWKLGAHTKESAHRY